jgi:hypothetical protein
MKQLLITFFLLSGLALGQNITDATKQLKNLPQAVQAQVSTHNLSVPANCIAHSGSATAYTCATTPTFTPAVGDHIQFEADVANTGTATLAVNGAAAAVIHKQGGSATIVANDLLAGHWISATFDGTYWQLEGQLGNAASTSPCTVTGVGSSSTCAFPGSVVVGATVSAGGSTNTTIGATGVTFPDGTVQNTKATGSGSVTGGSCGTNQYATSVGSNGAPTCAQVGYSQVSGSPTIPAAQVPANLASSGSTGVTGTLSANQVGGGYPAANIAAGTAPISITGNAATATASASPCTGGQVWTGAASGGCITPGASISTYTYATLPSSPTNGQIVVLSDGQNYGSCAAGGGTARQFCEYITGTGWASTGPSIPTSLANATVTSYTGSGTAYGSLLGCYNQTFSMATTFQAASPTETVSIFSVPAYWRGMFAEIYESTTTTTSNSQITALIATLQGTNGTNATIPFYLMGATAAGYATYDIAGFSGASTETGTQSLSLVISVANANPGNLGTGSASSFTGGAITVKVCGVTIQ